MLVLIWAQIINKYAILHIPTQWLSHLSIPILLPSIFFDSLCYLFLYTYANTKSLFQSEDRQTRTFHMGCFVCICLLFCAHLGAENLKKLFRGETGKGNCDIWFRGVQMEEQIHRRVVGGFWDKITQGEWRWEPSLKLVVQIPHCILYSTDFCRYESGLHKGTICHLIPQACLMLGEGDLWVAGLSSGLGLRALIV